MSVLAISEATSIEQTDCHRRDAKQTQQALVIATTNRRTDRAQHQHYPEQKTAEQRDLPDAAQIYELVALMAEPEAHTRRQCMRDRKIVTNEGAGDHRDESPEENIDPELLISGVDATIDDGRQKESGRQECRRN